MAPSGNSTIKSIIEWAALLVVALIVSVLIRQFLASPFVVPTGSMEPTIQIGDNIFAEKVTLELGGEPKAGDIVVFYNPNGDSDHDILVKRVIAVGGQIVDMKDGVVYVDGQALDEAYAQGKSYPLDVQAPGVQVSFPYTVPAGSIWVMGDNRENSADSRYFGAVSEDQVIGIGVFRYWPLDRIGTLG